MAEEDQQQGGGNNGAAAPAPARVKGGKQLESAYYSTISQMSADGRLLIAQDIEVFPSNELPHLASPGTRAYEVKDRRAPGEHFVMLCGRSGIPRVTMIGSYKSLRAHNIMKLTEAGIINWPAENRQRFALVFEKPAGRKLLDNPEGKPLHIAEDKILKAVIQPVLEVLAALEEVGCVHGSINLGNLYLAGTSGAETTIVGECLSSAPSLWQHPIYETPSRAVARPSGRGPGDTSDDVYALGVCVAMLLRGENLMLGKTEQQLCREKIEQGTYAALFGRERPTGAVSEFLRGALNDDPEMRWTVDDAVRWLEGRRISPKQVKVTLRAARPFMFMEQKYWDLRPLAQAFSENVTEAMKDIEGGQFENWLKRNFEDKTIRERLDRLIEKEKEADTQKLVTSICLAIDPIGPVRYKGMSVFPAGCGPALAEAFRRKQNVDVFGEMINHGFFNSWISQVFEQLDDASGLMGMFERARAAMLQRSAGYGIERVLYILNPEIACLSPALNDYVAMVPGSLLLGLERVARNSQRPATILDRHMIAFISVREPKMIDPYLSHINSADKGNHVVGVLRTLAGIQRRFSIGPVPAVGNWILSMAAPRVERLNDLNLRNDMMRQVGRLQDTGNLAAILELLDDRVLIQDDARRFAFARREYQLLTQEKLRTEAYLKRGGKVGQDSGRYAAMIVSMTISLLVISAYVMIHVAQVL